MRHGRVVMSLMAGGVLAGIALTPRPVRAQGTESPHGTLSTEMDCAACHTGDAWVPARDPLGFDHDRQTGFPLTGTHGEIACADCHLALRFDEPKGPGGDCASCHVDVHMGSLGLDCASCHGTDSFISAPAIEQHARTDFPLTGAHALVSCESCHVDDRGGQYSGLDTSCFSCHESDYASATFVDHASAGFPTECLECHSVQAWRLAPAFDHTAAANGFELLGAHALAPCEGCHIRPGNELRWQPAGESDCIACHQSDFDRQHQGSSIPTDCLQCHTRGSWDAGDFDHTLTGFELLGRHADLGCESCHGAGNQLRFPVPSAQDDCVSCHQSDYDRQHRNGNIPTTCADCHNTRNWDADENFDHAITGFQLLDPHGALVCSECHRASDNQLMFPTPAAQDDCVACHRSDYDVQHQGSAFPTSCLDCHASSHWDGAIFDHLSDTGFDLVGAHAALICEDCHRPSDNQLLFPVPSFQDDCVACHQADYDAEHQGTGFPTTCLDCHDTTQFAGAVFDHEGFFPIQSGKHQNAACQDCHTVPGDATVFSCLTCHEHRQSDMDDKHQGRSGYVYQSQACYNCHPDGRTP